MKQNKLRYLILAALMSALCVVGSFVKVPSTVGSAALDSAPAFLSASFLPPIYTMAVGAIGHLATALTSGFPLGPLHIIVALEMAIIVWIFAVMHKKGMYFLKWVVALVLNGIVSPLPFVFVLGWQFYVGALPGIFVATVINLIIVFVLMPIISKIAVQMKVKNV